MRTMSGTLRYFGRIKNGTTPASGESGYWNGGVKWATPEDLGKLTGDRITETKRQVTELAVEENNLSILPEGSIIISTRAPIGHMAINDEPMAFNQGCRGIIPGERVHGPFLYYLLKSQVPELNAIANGTTFVELSRDELAAVPVAFPPLETQRRIAAFLDEKTARIDELTEKKRALLEMLSEKRQALITRAVTKGFIEDAQIDNEGISSEWSQKRLNHQAAQGAGSMRTISGTLRYFGRIKNGTTPASGESGYWDGDVKWATPEDLGKLTGVRITGTKRQVTKLAVEETNLSVLPTGSIVISTRAPIGHMAINDEPMAFNQGCRGIIPGERVHELYLYYLLKSRVPELNAIANGTTFVEMSRDELAAIPVALPPLETQRWIAGSLDQKTAQIKELVEKISLSIEFLDEYRSALITTAVTGQT